MIAERESIELWHNHDDGYREQIFDFTLDEGKISFYATGFSVYEIVDAIQSVECTYDIETPDFPYVEIADPGWNKVKDLRTLTISTYNEQGFYICFYNGSNSDNTEFRGRFAKNGIVENLKANNRNGVTVTDKITDNDEKTVFDEDASYEQIIQNATANGAVRYFFEKNSDGTYYISCIDSLNRGFWHKCG